MSELWAEVAEFRGLYDISSYGRLRNARTKRLLKLSSDRYGYLYANMCDVKSGLKKSKSIHRMVAVAFLKGCGRDLQVNHKDYDKKNNHVQNLEWVTFSENVAHAVQGGRQKNRRPPSSRPTGARRLRGHQVDALKKAFLSGVDVRSLSEQYSLHQDGIADLLRGKTYFGEGSISFLRGLSRNAVLNFRFGGNHALEH